VSLRRSYFLFFLFPLAVLIVAMAKNTTEFQSLSPKGVLYFSNGMEIEKLELRTRRRETVVPKFDEEGRPVNSLYPVFSSMRNKMYFLRTYSWPEKCHVAVYEFRNQKIEHLLNFCGWALSLRMSSGSLILVLHPARTQIDPGF
jgi:hypothetical protein